MSSLKRLPSSALAFSVFLSLASFGCSDTAVSQPSHLQARGYNNPGWGSSNPGWGSSNPGWGSGNPGQGSGNPGYGTGYGNNYGAGGNNYGSGGNGYGPSNGNNGVGGYPGQLWDGPPRGTQRPPGVARCMGENYLDIHQCNVAVNKFPYTEPNGVIRSNRKKETSREGSCRVVLLCPGPVRLSSGRILHDANGQGGFQKLVDTCGTQRGIITLEGGCTVEVQNSSHK